MYPCGISFLPSSHTQSHYHIWPLPPGSQKARQVSPCNPSPAAECAGKDEHCKFMKGSEVQAALTKTLGSSQSSQRCLGIEAGKMGIQLLFSKSSAICSTGKLGGEDSEGAQCRGAEHTWPRLRSAKHFHMRKYRSHLKRCDQVLLPYIPSMPFSLRLDPACK